MKSDDLKKLLDLLGTYHYRIESHVFESKRIPNTELYEDTVSFLLKNGKDEINFKSSEEDVIKFVFSLERAITDTGEIEFGRFEDLNKYWSELDYLFTDEAIKTQDAVQRLRRGEFEFSYMPEDLLFEFLSAKHPNSKKFEPLKNNYFEIRAHYHILSQRALEQIERLKKENPKIEQNSRIIDEILMKAYRSDRNFMINLKKFSKSIDLDLNDLILQIKSELDFKNELKLMLVKNSPLDSKMGIRFLLDIYRRTSEQLAPFINALRISIEIADGKQNPSHKLRYIDNCNIIRLKPEYASLIECLDPNIRHSESHINTVIDSKSNKVIITSVFGKRREKICEYTFQQIIEMTLKLENELFLAFPMGFYYHRLGLIDTLLLSREYRVSLLSINNREKSY
jgi:hypothetical protein